MEHAPQPSSEPVIFPESTVDLSAEATPIEDSAAVNRAPFDPIKELKHVRELSPEEQQLDSDTQRDIITGRLAKYEERLSEQRLGISRAVQSLYEIVRANPDTDLGTLSHMVDVAAAQLGLSPAQKAHFSVGVSRYLDGHRAVERARADHPDDADLYKACFGFAPRGKVEVIKGPMTLMFRCWDENDYAAIYFGKDSITDDEFNKSYMTAGCALRRDVLLKGLKGAITAENGVHLPHKKESILSTKECQITPGLTEYIFTSEDSLTFELSLHGNRVSVTRLSLGNGKFYIDVNDWNIFHPENMKRYIFRDDSLSVDEVGGAKQAADTAQDWPVIHIGEPEKCEITLRPGTIAFNNITDQPIEGVIHTTRFTALDEYDDRVIDSTQIHEDRHQFNLLFRPAETEISQFMRGAEAARLKLPVDEAAYYMTRRQFQDFRRQHFDINARDEILAFYTDGQRSLDEILNTLTTSEYNYVKDYADEIEENRQEALKWGVVCAGDAAAKHTEIDPDKIDAIIKEVLDTKYKANLGRWVEAIRLLEQKGYHKPDILELLYQEPARNWPTLARQMPPKQAPETPTAA